MQGAVRRRWLVAAAWGLALLAVLLSPLRALLDQRALAAALQPLGPWGPLAFVLVPGLWLIETLGLFIKHGVLAVRLFANIMAGHTVLGVFLAFIAQVDGVLWGIVMPASILGQVGIGMLELFVAFLQAYVFSLLTSLFISAAVNPH